MTPLYPPRPALVGLCAVAAAVALAAPAVGPAQIEQTPTELWEEYPLDPTQTLDPTETPGAAREEGGGDQERPAAERGGDAPARADEGRTAAGDDVSVLPIAAAAAAVFVALLLAGAGVFLRGGGSLILPRLPRSGGWSGRFPDAVSRLGVAGGSLASIPGQLADRVQPVRTTRRLAGAGVRWAQASARHGAGGEKRAPSAKKPPPKKVAPAKRPTAKTAPPKPTVAAPRPKPAPPASRKPPKQRAARRPKAEVESSPPSQEAMETCVIVWRREGTESDFYALASNPERGEYVVATSPAFTWPGGEVPPAAWQAHDRLVTTLAEGGWRLVATEGPWYRRRFERPAGGYPAEVEASS